MAGNGWQAYAIGKEKGRAMAALCCFDYMIAAILANGSIAF
jgi:hypothetical protein